MIDIHKAILICYSIGVILFAVSIFLLEYWGIIYASGWVFILISIIIVRVDEKHRKFNRFLSKYRSQTEGT